MTDPQSAEAVRASDRAHGPGLYFGPCLPAITEQEWTTEQLEQFAAAWHAAQSGKVRLLIPLPRRVRLRLAFTRAIDTMAIRLVDHERYSAAERLWRVLRMRR